MLNLTPASIGFFTQFILALFISIYLLFHFRKHHTRQELFLAGFFSLATIYIGLMFLDTSLSPYPRLVYAVYLENSVLALGLVFLIQFAYHFPQRFPQHKLESRLSFILSLGYFLWELGFMIYRYILMFGEGTVTYRPLYLTYIMALVMVLPPLAFVRQFFAVDTRSIGWLKKFRRPEGKNARGARNFVGIFAIVLLLGIVNVTLINGLPHTIYNAATSIGILFTLWLFASNYINFIPDGISVQIKLVVLILTIFLALLGSVGWFVTPSYIEAFQPNLTDQQTLRFIPNDTGSYDITETDFSFEENLGEKLSIAHKFEFNNYEVEFDFPFFGQDYDQLYISSYGVIALGEPFWEPNLQAEVANFSAIIPLMVDMNPDPPEEQGGGMFVRSDEDLGRLIVTWYRLPSFYYSESCFTLQVVLYQDGVFEVTYNGLPLPIIYNPDDSPRANPWMRGVVSGQGESLNSNTTDLLVSAQTGTGLLLEDFQLSFRKYLHVFMLPFLYMILGGLGLILLSLPVMLRFSIIQPLRSLTKGVQQMESGDLLINLPVQNKDEIGYLTSAFNRLSDRLHFLVTGLEEQVDARTVDLQAEMAALKEAQAEILKQRSELAALEERARLSRELHDGLGQILSTINVEASAIQNMLKNKQIQSAESNLIQLTQTAREASANLRRHLMGLRMDALEARKSSPQKVESSKTTLSAVLSAYVKQFQESHGIKVNFQQPDNPDKILLPLQVEGEVIHIIQEAFINVVKHARANQVHLNLQVSENNLIVDIKDDGIGFKIDHNKLRIMNEGNSSSNGHFGLMIMRERAEEVGGNLEIHSTPGKGTQIQLSVPCYSKTGKDNEIEEIRGLRILLVDDHPLFLDGLHKLLQTRGLTVIDTAQNGQEAIEKTRALLPDIVIMDLNMPKCDGVEATRIITSEMPQVKVIILTIPESEDRLYEALRNGASGYLFKDLEINQLSELLIGLQHGEAAFSPGIAQRILTEFSQIEELSIDDLAFFQSKSTAHIISPRQMEVLSKVAEGYTYKEVGEFLHITERTVKFHMGKILSTLNLKTRREAVRYYKKQRGNGN